MRCRGAGDGCEEGSGRRPAARPGGNLPKWCGRRDSNPHDVSHWNLNPARLPIPPRPPVSQPANPDGASYQRPRRDAAKKWGVNAAAPETPKPRRRRAPKRERHRGRRQERRGGPPRRERAPPGRRGRGRGAWRGSPKRDGGEPHGGGSARSGPRGPVSERHGRPHPAPRPAVKDGRTGRFTPASAVPLRDGAAPVARRLSRRGSSAGGRAGKAASHPPPQQARRAGCSRRPFARGPGSGAPDRGQKMPSRA